MENTVKFSQGQRVKTKETGSGGLVISDGDTLIVKMDGWENPEFGINGELWVDHDGADEVFELESE